VSDVVMYWREDPVVGVDEAELPQFSIEEWATNERKIKLATGIEIEYSSFNMSIDYRFTPI
jgi:hypothetical protein